VTKHASQVSSGIFVHHNYRAAKNERFCGSRHSDKERFRSDLNRPKSCEISERLLKTLRYFGDFQAEYEGSIPFTRSDFLRCFAILCDLARF
jgi:hypothetical protein